MGVAQQRILAERKNWRKDKPFGFFARPEVQEDGCVWRSTFKHCDVP